MDDLLTESNSYLEFKGIFDRFDLKEAKTLEIKDTSMQEVEDEPQVVEKDAFA